MNSGMSEKNFRIEDSGQKEVFLSGMQRNNADNKVDYTLALDGPMFERYAIHLTNGAKIYAKRNWMQANSPEEMERFRVSAFRHMIKWMLGHTNEDHAAAVIFNINGYEYVKEKLNG